MVLSNSHFTQEETDTEKGRNCPRCATNETWLLPEPPPDFSVSFPSLLPKEFIPKPELGCTSWLGIWSVSDLSVVSSFALRSGDWRLPRDSLVPESLLLLWEKPRQMWLLLAGSQQFYLCQVTCEATSDIIKR